MAGHKRQPDLATQLRTALKATGLTRAELTRRSGLAYSQIHGFLAGTRDITLGTASRLCALVELEFRPAQQRTRQRKGD